MNDILRSFQSQLTVLTINKYNLKVNKNILNIKMVKNTLL